jgi:hypothetical protein
VGGGVLAATGLVGGVVGGGGVEPGEAPDDPLHAAASSSAPSTALRHAIGATVGVSVVGVPDTTCESCGAVGEDLYAVHRQYVTPAEWDTPGREVTLDEVERWCYSCLTHYPHVLVESDPSGAADG